MVCGRFHLHPKAGRVLSQGTKKNSFYPDPAILYQRATMTVWLGVTGTPASHSGVHASDLEAYVGMRNGSL